MQRLALDEELLSESALGLLITHNPLFPSDKVSVSVISGELPAETHNNVLQSPKKSVRFNVKEDMKSRKNVSI